MKLLYCLGVFSFLLMFSSCSKSEAPVASSKLEAQKEMQCGCSSNNSATGCQCSSDGLMSGCNCHSGCSCGCGSD